MEVDGAVWHVIYRSIVSATTSDQWAAAARSEVAKLRRGLLDSAKVGRWLCLLSSLLLGASHERCGAWLDGTERVTNRRKGSMS